MRADARKHPEESATSAGELTLGSPSFRTGMAAAREAAEREAAALRDEAETLRDANEKLLAQVARLGRDNDRLNEAQAETTVAELAARAELVRRNAALAREATRERKNKSKVFFVGAAACGAYAVAAGASFGIVGADIFTGAMGVSAVAVVTVAGVVSACFAAWAVVFSAPNADVRALALPVETVALVDEDDVVLADRATEGARLVADTDAMETMKNGDEGDEGGETSESPTAAITAPTSPAMTAPTSPAAPRRVSFDDVANPGTAGTAPPPPEDAPRNKVRLFDTDGEDKAANARRNAEIAKLRGELGVARADADRLRQSRNRLARRAEGMRDENEALTAARDEVMSQAETMSLARSARGATNAESAERERAEQRDRERREETLRRQLSNFRAANERLEEELAALRKRTDDAEAEAEAATAEASLYENPPEDSDAKDGGASFPDAIDGDAYAAAMRRAAKAESALRPALDRAGESRVRASVRVGTRGAFREGGEERRYRRPRRAGGDGRADQGEGGAREGDQMAQGIARASSPRGGGASKRQRRARARIETERRASGRGGRTSDVVARTRVDARAEPRRRRKTRRGGDSRQRYPRTRSQGGGGGGPEGAREGIRRGGASTRAGRRRGGERGDARRRPSRSRSARRGGAPGGEDARGKRRARARSRGGEGSVTRRERGGGGGDEDEEPGGGDERGDEREDERGG